MNRIVICNNCHHTRFDVPDPQTDLGFHFVGWITQDDGRPEGYETCDYCMTPFRGWYIFEGNGYLPLINQRIK